jgi:UTP--glucose-1-phosphate uridylyltransferase
VLTCVRRDGNEDYKRYGYVDGKELAPGLLDMATVIEKPGSRTKAPSDLATVSGYLFDPAILDYLQRQLKNYDHNKGEFNIQTAMQAMVENGHHIYAHEVTDGTFYDTGNPVGYLKTVFDFALQRAVAKGGLRDHLRHKLH